MYGIETTPLFWVNGRLMQGRPVQAITNQKNSSLALVVYEFTPYILTPGGSSAVVKHATYQAVMERRWTQLGFTPANQAGEKMLRRTTAQAAGKKYVVSTLPTVGAKERQEAYE